MGIIFIVIYGIFIILGDIYPYKYQRSWADDLGHLVAYRAAARKGVAGYAREEGGGTPTAHIGGAQELAPTPPPRPTPGAKSKKFLQGQLFGLNFERVCM